MLRRIKLLRNVGAFQSDSSAGSIELKRLVLVYAENGLGKTTLSAVLRSLATGNPQSIIGRRRLGTPQPPHVVLELESGSPSAVFRDGAWNQPLPYIKAFDDVFVDENVYSGLEVDSQHRQNLHTLILGEQGVELNERLNASASHIEQHNGRLREKADLIPEGQLRGLSIDAFCDLPELPDVEAKIETTRLALEVARNQDVVRTTPLFDTIKLPEFDTEAIKQVLETDLPNLGSAAEDRVQEHVNTLGIGGEAWVAEGMNRVPKTEEWCPFCGQDLNFSDLIKHYRAYFSEGYTNLKQSVAQMLQTLDITHAGGIQAEFERVVRIAGERRQSWLKFCSIPEVEIDTEAVVNDWSAAREAVAELLREGLNKVLPG